MQTVPTRNDIWDEARLLALIRNRVQESLNLDYKKSAALCNSGAIKEISKDVSALANAEGGTLVYGIVENGHVPTAFDEGCDPTSITKEWLENVVTSNTHPTIAGLRIMQVPLSGDHAGRVAYVLVVPQAQSLAPHQANDKRINKRRNFKSDPMDDYEVRDMMRRATVPNLAVSLLPVPSIPHRYGANEVPVVFLEGAEYSDPIGLRLSVRNLSPAPAFYARFSVDCPQELLHTPHGGTMQNTRGAMLFEGDEMTFSPGTQFFRTHGIPNDLPLWEGEEWFPENASFPIAIPAKYQNGSCKVALTCADINSRSANNDYRPRDLCIHV